MGFPLRIMFDLETLSTHQNASILSIGAVVFGGVSCDLDAPKEFYVNVNDPLGMIDLDTVRWWLGRSKEAQERLDSTFYPAFPLQEALRRFSAWLQSHISGPLPLKDAICGNPLPDVEFWSRSPSFDEVILKNAYRREAEFFPIHRRWSRDCRTLEAMAGMKLEDQPKKTNIVLHDALVDAKEQAEHAKRCMSNLVQLVEGGAG